MISDKIINEAFVEALLNKIPKKAKLADFIVDTLHIEKETAYRRLRSVTMFSFYEITLLAKKINISLDEIIINCGKELPVTDMMIRSYYEEKKENVNDLKESSLAFVSELAKQPFSEFGAALKSIPYPFMSTYQSISRYYKLKYEQHKNNPSQTLLFKEISLSESDTDPLTDEYAIFQEITHTVYIWDKKIIPIIINDIKHFRSLGIMDDNDVETLKKELLQLVNQLESIATHGMFESTGNKVDIYISDEDIDSTYTYLWSEQLCLSTLVTHMCYMLLSYNNQIKCKETIDWITSMKFNSTLISGTGGKDRVLFFNRQRELIKSLSVEE